MFNSNKIVLFCRSASGAGKSSFAQWIKAVWDDDMNEAIICCADDYFEKDGKYQFNPSELGRAHSLCQWKFRKALTDGRRLVIVANTNCYDSDVKLYQDLAEKHNYTFISLVLEKRHNGKNQHGLTDEKIKQQAERLKNSLKLY